MELGSFDRRLIRLPAGGRRLYDESEWDDSLVIVTCGTVELEDVDGKRWRFAKGSIFWLTDLPLLALHNPSDDAAILMAINRR